MKAANSYALDVLEIFLITVGNICGSGLYDTEAILRVLVAFGTVLLVDDVFRQRARDLNMSSILHSFVSQHGDKAVSISKEIEQILS